MTDLPTAEASLLHPPKWASFFFLVLFVPLVVLFFQVVTGWHFLPNQDWVARMWPHALVLGLAVASFTYWILRYHIDRREVDDVDLKSGLLILGIFILSFFTGYTSILVYYPMSEALLFGRRTEMRFTVESLDPIGYKYCRPKIDLEGLPISSNSLCRPSKALWRTLEPGMKVVVTGRGTPHGLFVGRVTRAD